MALQKQTIPMQFQAGLDTRQDSKGGLAPRVNNLENALFDHPGAFNKRFGLSTLTNLIEESDEAIASGNALSAFRDQLLVFDSNRMYSKVDYKSFLPHVQTDNSSASNWLDKGAISCAINSNFSVVKNSNEQTNASMASLLNLNCYVYEDSVGGIKYSIMDLDTKNVLVNDQLILIPGSSPMVFALQASGSVAAQFVIIFRNNGVLQMTRIYFNAVHDTLLIEVIAADLDVDAPQLFYTGNPTFDACVSRASINNNGTVTVLESILVAYSAQAITYVVLVNQFPKTIQITAGSVIAPNTIDGSTIGATKVSPRLISVCPIVDVSSDGEAVVYPSAIISWIDINNSFWISKVVMSTATNMVRIQFSPSTTIFTFSEISKISMVWNGDVYNQANNQTTLSMFLEQRLAYDIDVAGNQVLKAEPSLMVGSFNLEILVANTITAIGDVIDNDVSIARQISIYSRPFIQAEKTYIICNHDSTLQSTYFLMDNSLNVISKINENAGGGWRTVSAPTEVVTSTFSFGNMLEAGSGIFIYVPVSSNKWQFASLKKGKLISQGNTQFSLTGVESSTFDFESPYTF